MPYNPTDEFDELEDPPGIPPLGEGRRRELDALDAKNRLDTVDDFHTLEELTDSIREISLVRRDERIVRGVPKSIIETIESAYDGLPVEAKPEYLADDVLRRRINTARRRFNDWMDVKQRLEKMPSPVESGPANYPAQKARDRSSRAREASDDLDDALDRVESGARGARQRALEAVGSSVAEQNEKRAQNRTEEVKSQIQPGWVVFHFSTSYDYRPFVVKRLNKKSVRLRTRNPRAGEEYDDPLSGETITEDEFIETTVDYDSDWLKIPPESDSPDLEFDLDDFGVADGNKANFETFETWEETVRHYAGDDWVDSNLDADHFFDDEERTDTTDNTDPNDPMTYDPSSEWTDDRPQQDILFETTAKDQAARDRETRIETGASDEFADDRHQEASADTGDQATLTAETVEEQADLTGEQAMTDPEWDDSESPQTRPISDVSDDLLHPVERMSEESETYHYDPVTGRAYSDLNDDPDAEEEAETAGVDPAEVYDPTEDVPEDGIVMALAKDLTPFTNTASAVSEAVRDEEPTVEKPTPDSGELPPDSAETPSDHEEPPEGPEPETESEMPAAGERIEFGRRDAANEFRTAHSDHLHESDDRRKKTVTFRADTPESVLDKAGKEAMVSQPQGKQYGQAALTDTERDRLEDRESFSYADGHLFHARAAKALLQAEGGTPWLDYYDPNLTVDEHLSVIEQGKAMAVEQGTTSPGEMNLDREKSDAEIARDLDRAGGEVCNHAEDGCQDGHEEACEVLLEDCGYSKDEIERLLDATRALGEEPAEVYDPTTEGDTGTSFEKWARESEPTAPEEVPPEMFDPPAVEEPTDEELVEIAPSRPEELSGATLRALKKAWAGYRAARAEDRQAHEHMKKYAEIINGIRVVNGQKPLDFDDREGWDGGEVLPDNSTEDFPVGDGTRQKSLSEAVHDGVTGVLGGTQATLGDTYDPINEW